MMILDINSYLMDMKTVKQHPRLPVPLYRIYDNFKAAIIFSW